MTHADTLRDMAKAFMMVGSHERVDTCLAETHRNRKTRSPGGSMSQVRRPGNSAPTLPGPNPLT